jgi:hypothetical protein
MNEGGKKSTQIATAAFFVSLASAGFAFLTLYANSLSASNLSFHIAPDFLYSSPRASGNLERIEIPITFVNDGARTAVVQTIELIVVGPPDRGSKRFRASWIARSFAEQVTVGSYSRTIGRELFSPISLLGRSSRTETIVFSNQLDGTDQRYLTTEGRFSFGFSFGIAGEAGRMSTTVDRILPRYIEVGAETGALRLISP